MTQIGSVIDGKYEILKEIGRGGMSVVYLAMDKRLNKQWAVKEIKKQGGKKNEEIVVNSLLAEANLMKRLDHPALPRIVDIFDTGATIYVIMDYIEGESLDKILETEGPRPEPLVISWGKQLCDALGYLHSQKPPIIYRDMKPANVMLKPEGNIKIIDFGIAREYKEDRRNDTMVLGTKGYAPPEQYSGQTDARSDIFALGMTMHQLLTGVDPRNGEGYVSVRQWNPALSEGIEVIIDKCVEPAPENRYQSCADLLYDLEHPELVTKGFKKKQKRKLFSFLAALGLALFMAAAGFVLNLVSTNMTNGNYDTLLGTSSVSSYYEAVSIYPGRPEAYEKLIDYYINHSGDEEFQGDKAALNKAIDKLGTQLNPGVPKLDPSDPEAAKVFYDMGKLFFSIYDAGSLKGNASLAAPYFDIAAGTEAEYEKKEIAVCYKAICDFMNTQSNTREHTKQEYDELFSKLDEAAEIVEASTDGEANYDRISLYYVGMTFINDQARLLAGVGYEKEEILGRLEKLYQKAKSVTSSLSYVTELQGRIEKAYGLWVNNVEAQFDEVEKWK